MAFPNILNLYPLYDMNIHISVAYFVTMQVDFLSSYTRQIFGRKNNQVFWENSWYRDGKTDVPLGSGLFNVLRSSGFSSSGSMHGLRLLSECSCFFWYKHWFLPCLAALQALKRKKRFEKQLSQVDGTLSTIEFQREALENSHTNTEVLRNMGFAAKAMKAVHENMWVTQTSCP